ncbi:hypothetical protein CYY_007970 [Polysphondylium violaceum]|uniref:Ubiquitin-like 1-activating enzyme E1A n=1 Tax=Polysphondylium violaceum TaxID=133409 RepID=A0A8J4PPZ3_9MYCE|nr:hypothetical protein CYY_007970 [Polysphondylium violaceum]
MTNDSLGAKEPVNQLTDYEAALYDRGIRLWGVDAQNRLRQAKVLFIGINSLMSEIIKNTVLAGIDSITLIDNHIVTIQDLSCHLFLTHDSIGKKRADESVQSITELNPLVKVHVVDKEIESIDKEFLQAYTIVCLNAFDLNLVSKFDTFCREINIPLIATHSFGLYGFFFSDLSDFEYIKKTEKKEKDQEEPVIEYVNHKVSFPSFETAMNIQWSKTNPRRTSPLLYALTVLYQFEQSTKSIPSIENPSHLSKILEIIDGKLSASQMPSSEQEKYLHITNLLIKHQNHEIAPTCAVLGGIVGAEIIKIISKNNHVLNNIFFYDNTKGTGVVETMN